LVASGGLIHAFPFRDSANSTALRSPTLLTSTNQPFVTILHPGTNLINSSAPAFVTPFAFTFSEVRPRRVGGAADEDERVGSVVEHDHGTPVLSLGFGGDEHRETFRG